MPTNCADKSKILLIKEFLDKQNYHCLLKSVKYEDYYKDPWIKPLHFSRIKQLDIKHQILLDVFLLGNNVDITSFCIYYNQDILEYLQYCKIISIREKTIVSNGYSIISCFDFYLIVETKNIISGIDKRKKNIVNLYIGPDSYRLSTYLSSCAKMHKALDLCSGSGIQAMICARNAEKVVAVELNKNVIPDIKFNVVINDLESIIEIKQGDLFEVVGKGDKFDCISVNPPFLAIPEGIMFPICGLGGIDGMKLVKKILRTASTYLKENGQLIMVMEAIGGKSAPFITKDIFKVSKYNSFSTTCIYHDRQIVELIGKYYANISQEINPHYSYQEIKKIFLEHYKEMGVNYSYSTTVQMRKLQSQQLYYFQELKLYNKWTINSVPLLNKKFNIVENNGIYEIRRHNKTIKKINQNTKKFLEMCNGKNTLLQLLKSLVNTQPFNIELSEKYLLLCYDFQCFGIIEMVK